MIHQLKPKVFYAWFNRQKGSQIENKILATKVELYKSHTFKKQTIANNCHTAFNNMFVTLKLTHHLMIVFLIASTASPLSIVIINITPV